MTQDRRVAIIGLGYVGLPLAIAFAEAGLEVDGVDVSAGPRGRAQRATLADRRHQRSSSWATRSIARLRVLSTADARLADADAVFVCVPTPITTTKDPDLAPVLAAAQLVRDSVRAGHLVVLQSTTFPGTTIGPVPRGRRGERPARRDATSTSPSPRSG